MRIAHCNTHLQAMSGKMEKALPLLRGLLDSSPKNLRLFQWRLPELNFYPGLLGWDPGGLKKSSRWQETLQVRGRRAFWPRGLICFTRGTTGFDPQLFLRKGMSSDEHLCVTMQRASVTAERAHPLSLSFAQLIGLLLRNNKKKEYEHEPASF